MNELALKKILICARNQLYRDTLAKAILAVSRNYDITGTTSDITKIGKYLIESSVDYLLVDLDGLSINPFDFIKRICLRFPNTKLIILTFWDYLGHSARLLNSGASFCYVTGQRLEVLIQNLDKDITPKTINCKVSG